jgi:hypothetical protein
MQNLLRLDLQALAPSGQRQLTRLVQSQQFEAPHERSDMRIACRKVSPGHRFAHRGNCYILRSNPSAKLQANI